MGLDLSYSPEPLKLGRTWRLFASCDLEILRMTLKNNKPPLLCPFKLYASFGTYWWIPIWVTVRKRTNWVLTSVTLTFDPWPWPFAWTSFLSRVITPENFMMIRWQDHSEKGVTDGRTDRRTDGQDHSYSCLVAAKKHDDIDILPFHFRRFSQSFYYYHCSCLNQWSCYDWLHWKPTIRGLHCCLPSILKIIQLRQSIKPCKTHNVYVVYHTLPTEKWFL